MSAAEPPPSPTAEADAKLEAMYRYFSTTLLGDVVEKRRQQLLTHPQLPPLSISVDYLPHTIFSPLVKTTFDIARDRGLLPMGQKFCEYMLVGSLYAGGFSYGRAIYRVGKMSWYAPFPGRKNIAASLRRGWQIAKRRKFRPMWRGLAFGIWFPVIHSSLEFFRGVDMWNTIGTIAIYHAVPHLKRRKRGKFLKSLGLWTGVGFALILLRDSIVPTIIDTYYNRIAEKEAIVEWERAYVYNQMEREMIMALPTRRNVDGELLREDNRGLVEEDYMYVPPQALP
jgi:hypothetical protein